MLPQSLPDILQTTIKRKCFMFLPQRLCAKIGMYLYRYCGVYTNKLKIRKENEIKVKITF